MTHEAVRSSTRRGGDEHKIVARTSEKGCLAKQRRSRQLVEQRLGILQDRRVETFREPAIDWGE
jgi:hypothetical protein